MTDLLLGTKTRTFHLCNIGKRLDISWKGMIANVNVPDDDDDDDEDGDNSPDDDDDDDDNDDDGDDGGGGDGAHLEIFQI